MKLITVASSKPLTTATCEATVLFIARALFVLKDRFYIAQWIAQMHKQNYISIPELIKAVMLKL